MFNKEELALLESAVNIAVEYVDGEIEIIEEFDGDASGNHGVKIEYTRLLEKVRKM